MSNSILRFLSCLAFLAVIGAPAQGEGAHYAQMPDELFVPKANPHRDTSANVVAIEQETVSATRIISHGRQVRVVGVPFMPDVEESIDFIAATEPSWWSTMVVDSLAAWLAPVGDDDAPSVAIADASPRLSNLETAANFVLE